jgi:uncharacterized membrane protein
MNQNIKNVLRWMVVIPTAIIAAILVLFPIRWFVFFSGISETWVAEILKHIGIAVTTDNIERLLDALFVGGTFVYAGAKMAPNHHFKTAIALSTVLILVFVYLVYLINSHQGYRLDETVWSMGIKIALVIFSIGAGVYYSKELD